PVNTQREIHLEEQARNGIGRNRNIDLLKKLCDLLGCLTGPLQSRDRVPGGIVLQDNLDGIGYFGRYFSTGLRPPPALRARSTSTSCANNCCLPRATVRGLRSRKSARLRSPPRPSLSDSRPAYKRRCCSSSRL